MAAQDSPRATALGKIPTSHSLALRLREAGMSDELIAERLGIDQVAVGPLLAVAEAKLAAILGQLDGEFE